MLNPLVSFIRTLPLPATHPSHPAASSIQTALTDAQRGYADMRGTWIRRCLESDAKRVVEGHGDGYASGKDIDAATAGIREGQEFGIWVEGVIDVAEACTLSFSDLSILTDILERVQPSRKARAPTLDPPAHRRLCLPNHSPPYSPLVFSRAAHHAREACAPAQHVSRALRTFASCRCRRHGPLGRNCQAARKWLDGERECSKRGRA